MKTINDEIKSMYDGDYEAIIAGIQSETPILVMNAIIAGVQHNVQDKKYVEGLRKEKENDIELLNVQIKDVAIAGLDILGIEKYMGNDVRIKKYISTGLK